MNEKEAKKILKPFEMYKKFPLWEFERIFTAKGYLEAIEKVTRLEEQLGKVVSWCEGIKEKQYNLLVKGQDFESASKNWEEATTLNEPLEWGEIKKVLAQWKKDK